MRPHPSHECGGGTVFIGGGVLPKARLARSVVAPPGPCPNSTGDGASGEKNELLDRIRDLDRGFSRRLPLSLVAQSSP